MTFNWTSNGRPGKPIEVCKVGQKWELELWRDNLIGYYVNIRYNSRLVDNGREYGNNSNDANGKSKAKHDAQNRFIAMIRDADKR